MTVYFLYVCALRLFYFPLIYYSIFHTIRINFNLVGKKNSLRARNPPPRSPSSIRGDVYNPIEWRRFRSEIKEDVSRPCQLSLARAYLELFSQSSVAFAKNLKKKKGRKDKTCGGGSQLITRWRN